MTRMLFLGTPGAKVKRTYRAVLEAQLAAIDAVRAGALDASAWIAPRARCSKDTDSTAPSFTPPATVSDSRSTNRRASAKRDKDQTADGHGDHHRAWRLSGRFRRHSHRRHGSGDGNRLRDPHADQQRSTRDLKSGGAHGRGCCKIAPSRISGIPICRNPLEPEVCRPQVLRALAPGRQCPNLGDTFARRYLALMIYTDDSNVYLVENF